jgi:hypothetical protein
MDYVRRAELPTPVLRPLFVGRKASPVDRGRHMFFFLVSLG